MGHDALEVVKLRRNFHRDSYRVIAVLLLIALIAIVVLSSIVLYQETHQPTPKYFATTSSGKLIPMVPLDEPNLSNQAILQWAATAASSLYTYNFVNYRDVFSSNAQYFTRGGYSAFLNQVSDSRNLGAVTSKKLMLTGVPAGAPVITDASNVDGIYTWTIQVPIVVTYQSLSTKRNASLLLIMQVKRLSTLDSKYGIGISNLVVEEK